jgi:AcrR family transcriptional regulator
MGASRAAPVRRGVLNANGDGKGSQLLLEAAAELFRNTGYTAATTRALAARLGMRSASLYYHMTKKEDLLYSICVDALERISAAVATKVDAEPDPKAKTRTLIRAHLEVALADRNRHATMLIELRHLGSRRRAKVVALRDAYEASVRKVVREGQAAGAIRSDIPAKYLTLALLNLLNWSIFWYHPGRGLSPDELGELLATVFLEGVALSKARRS